ncbi:unnamed protein product [Prorocentrum cordatum]|uniref:Pentacotripeptide-repeat region of PRORP domain-containing protein n=1 Tax=Prorocentrum cordatum TaxID=2364126 RepID=A0ABN9UQS0_9DINO|nr:unnamed protein product [Polarella glacialis]
MQADVGCPWAPPWWDATIPQGRTIHAAAGAAAQAAAPRRARWREAAPCLPLRELSRDVCPRRCFRLAGDAAIRAAAEVLVFAIAIVAHSLIFSKHTVQGKARKARPAPGPPAKLGRAAAGREAPGAGPRAGPAAAPCGALLRGAGTAEQVLAAYEGQPAAADVLADPQAGKAVAAAAIGCGRRDLLRRLVSASPGGPRQVGLLKSFGAEQDLSAALQVFEACPEKTVCLHNALLDICVDLRDMAAAERVMSRAAEAGVADVCTYNIIIKAYLKSGDLPRARSAIRAMRSGGLVPNAVTFNELIDAAVRAGREDVWGLVDEMRACGVKPNQVTLSTLLKNVQRSSRVADLERTIAMLDAMDESLDEVLLGSVCEACIRAGRADLVATQLKKRRGGEGGGRVRGAHTFGSLIRAHGFIQDLEGVWSTWNEMRSAGILPTSITLGCMVEAVVSNDGPDAGLGLILDMRADGATRPLLNAVIYCSVLKGVVREKRFDRVWDIYQEMQAEKEQLQFSVTTYNTLIDACARSGDMSTIIKGHCQENRLDEAFELLENMKRSKGLHPDEITYNTLLDGCSRHGMFDRGMELLQEMQDAGVPPSNFTLSVLVKLAKRSHMVDKAFEVCDDISRKYRLRLNVHVFNNLIHACTAQHDVDRALGVFRRMLKERVHPDGRTYSLLLRAAADRGDAEEAAALLRAAVGLPDPHPLLAGAGAAALQLRGAPPAELLSEGLEGIAKLSEPLALQLVKEMRPLRSVRLDSRLVLRLASKPGPPRRGQ